jgi:hypothetical protein
MNQYIPNFTYLNGRKNKNNNPSFEELWIIISPRFILFFEFKNTWCNVNNPPESSSDKYFTYVIIN